MPELPEVETIRRQLEDVLIDKKIVVITCDTSKVLKPSVKKFTNAVTGFSIRAIQRRAKLLVFELDNGTIFTAHLRMNGRFLYRTDISTVDKYVHVVFEFEDKTELRFADSRKFGFLELLPTNSTFESIKAHYGPEPFDDLTLPRFIEILKNSRRVIKDLLLDQKSIAGVGNIYANDALWLAKVHPKAIAASIRPTQMKSLFQSLESVLAEGIKDKGASDMWYVHVDGSKGSYQESTLRYMPAKENLVYVILIL